MTTARVESVRMILKLSTGIIALVVGIDKFFNLLTDWDKYLSPVVTDTIPLSAGTIMIILGIIEIIIGLAILTIFPQVGGYALMVWLWLTAIGLIIGGYYEIALMDIGVSMGALSLAMLSNKTINR